MASGTDTDPELRRVHVALGAALGLAVAALGFALWLRYGPAAGQSRFQYAAPVEVAHDSAAGELSVMTAAATAAESLPVLDSARPAEPPPAPAAVITEVVLLPCTEPNPRPDGRFLIPPHDPAHRTIVGLPSRPGEPRRGLVIPPHDPGVENRIPLQVVPMDSLLEHTIRIPPHDPTRFKLVRPDTVPCLNL